MSHGPVIHFFAGKGGSGKSTLATAYAMNLLEANGKDRVLLLSLETPGGVADLLKKKLSNKPTKIALGKGTGGLFAAEVDFPALGEAYLKFAKPQLMAAVTKGAVLSEDDLKKVLEASLTNQGEVGFLFNLLELAEAKEYEKVVIDGWSSTHTLRLLDHATNVRRLVGLVRAERTQRPSKTTPRAATPVDELALRADAVNAMLKDPKRFAMHVCAVAEPVGESQIKNLVKGLTERAIPVAEIIADMIEDGKGSREVENRRGLQAPHVRKFQTMASKVELIQRRILGPRGQEEVKKFAKEWSTGKETKQLQFTPAEAPPALVRAPSMPPMAAPPIPPTRFIFFVGSGGVGKSSCAAAAAVTLTEKEGPVLLLSIDPSHSLSDVLQSRLTDTETQVKGTKGLYAREIDFANWFGNLKKKLKELAEPMFGPEAKGETFSLDKELFRNLLDLAPVGMDELAAVSALTDALVQERFKRIVIDPAPSSNSLRILELPGIARPWLASIHAVATKYKAKGGQALLTWVEALQAHLDRFEKATLNPNECRFIVVTRGEELSVPAAERIVESLKAKSLPVERVLVNRVLPKTTCLVTEERRKNELEVAKLVEKKIGLPVTMAPALGRHPAGLRELKGFRTSWYAAAAVLKSKAA
ncbi:MAG: TRC40/GET3/ArsA family transport-energizing ATPase [Archangium sp.]|nr:TRC40/GET3/ArsA family transport-energizing ATPase [Archangium sp.]MDP3157909.1 TRC40/GET3/ArsA family transport-energizing ATPase [Archangium sp.]MDP3571849.1 TRC40/GET3/ArsA family transport-energizing ATPase [Archangium sp.]